MRYVFYLVISAVLIYAATIVHSQMSPTWVRSLVVMLLLAGPAVGFFAWWLRTGTAIIEAVEKRWMS